MNHYVTHQDKLEQGFKQVFPLIRVIQGAQPIVRFPMEAVQVIREMATLRMKNWQTTTRWDASADATGLLGELAVQCYLGYSAEKALAAIFEGLEGDKGYDIKL